MHDQEQFAKQAFELNKIVCKVGVCVFHVVRSGLLGTSPERP